uniref:Transposase n=1 Tax=Strongyloides stercoralis TaxID=6248 RepID=A0A0K0EL38_STRER
MSLYETCFRKLLAISPHYMKGKLYKTYNGRRNPWFKTKIINRIVKNIPQPIIKRFIDKWMDKNLYCCRTIVHVSNKKVYSPNFRNSNYFC